MPTTKTWTYAINNYGPIGSGSSTGGETDQVRAAYCPWTIYTALTGNWPSSPGGVTGAWELLASCDGVTKTVGSTDVLGYTFNSSKWVFSQQEGSAHSWFVLKSKNPGSGGLPGGPYYMTVTCTALSASSSAVYYGSPNVFISTTIPDIASGSATQTPNTYSGGTKTITTPVGSSNNYPSRNFMMPYFSTPQPFYARPHFCIADDGSFVLVVTYDNSTSIAGYMAVGTTTNLPVTDTYNTVVYWVASSQGQSWVQETGGYWFGWDPDGNVQSYVGLTPVASYNGGSYTFNTVLAESFAMDDYTNKVNTYPAYLYCPTVGKKHIKGQLVDMQLTLGQPAIPQGTGILESSTLTYIAMHPFWIPANAYPEF